MNKNMWVTNYFAWVALAAFAYNYAALAAITSSNLPPIATLDKPLAYGDLADPNASGTSHSKLGSSRNDYGPQARKPSVLQTNATQQTTRSLSQGQLASPRQLSVEATPAPVVQRKMGAKAAMQVPNLGKRQSREAMFSECRTNMVANQIAGAGRGITQPAVIAAMSAVPRHQFTPAVKLAEAYLDKPIDIDGGRRIESPYVVASVSSQLNPGGTDRVLELGTGSGYQTAILSLLAKTVYTMESSDAFAERSEVNLRRLGYTNNIVFRHGDTAAGWPEAAPFDVIVVNDGLEDVPAAIQAQLKEGGRLIFQVQQDGTSRSLQKIGQRLQPLASRSVRPVPMTGGNAALLPNLPTVRSLEMRSN